ncbi:hypothetical protein AGDE_03744 [Angomonas deanei]|nr:hypothetical protein AGDE_03744 [Angomonas deanei]|eukprot:EPY40184.1 hypothetical protein AGDE_03744 [Angomonas deanei]
MSTDAPVSSIFDNHQLVLRYGALAILGGYAVSIAYRVGLVQKVLPAAIYQKIESTVEAVKAKTQPIGDAKRFALARAHLTRTYTLTSLGMSSFIAGVLTFVVQPKVPIVVPMIVTIMSALLVVAVPRRLLLRPYRILCHMLCFYAAGYSFGPIGWVAQDSLFLCLLLTVCTMAGLVTPLFLTRGLISYLLSSQLLSLTLSIAFFTAPKEAKLKYSPFNMLKEQRGVQLILSADYNILLTLQFVGDLLILGLHTLPIMYYFVSAKAEPTEESDEKEEAALLNHVDDVREAFCICTGWSYLVYRTVKHFARFFVEKVINESNEKKKTNDSRQDHSWQILAERRASLSGASGACSGLMMVLLYIKVISILQRDDPKMSLDQFRRMCNRFSPLEAILQL